MDLNALRVPELVQVCTNLGIDLGQATRKAHIIKLIEATDVSEEELTESLEYVREKESREKERERREREDMERADKLEQKKLELETLRRALARVEVRVEPTSSKYLAQTYPHLFLYKSDQALQENDVVVRDEEVRGPSTAHTRHVAVSESHAWPLERSLSRLFDEPLCLVSESHAWPLERSLSRFDSGSAGLRFFVLVSVGRLNFRGVVSE